MRFLLDRIAEISQYALMDSPEPYDLATGPSAQIVGCSQSSLTRWAEQGLIPHVRTPGGHMRFRRSDLDEFNRSRAAQAS